VKGEVGRAGNSLRVPLTNGRHMHCLTNMNEPRVYPHRGDAVAIGDAGERHLTIYKEYARRHAHT